MPLLIAVVLAAAIASVVPLVKVGCGKHAVVRLVVDDPGAIPEEDQSHGLA
jgi:hypothetical protein